MDTIEALSFLREHQPMPPDDQLTGAEVTRYEEVRLHLLSQPTPACIPLLLGSFGDGGGFGVYQLVEDVLRKFPGDLVVPHLVEALESPHRGVRYWCAQISAIFPDEKLVGPLARLLLRDADSDVRTAAVVALGQIGADAAMVALRDALDRENDATAKELIADILSLRSRDGRS